MPVKHIKYFVIRVLLSGVIGLAFLLSPNSLYAKEFPEFDLVAGFPGVMTFDASSIDRIAGFEGKKLTFIGDCEGISFEKRAYVESSAVSFALESSETEKSGACKFSILDPKGNMLLSDGSFEIFAGVPVEKKLRMADGDTLRMGETSEFLGGYFDGFGNPATAQLVLMSSDGIVETAEKDADGYTHFFFTPDRGGKAKLTLVDPISGDSNPFSFIVETPESAIQSAPLTASSVGGGGRGDAVTQLLGELIRASLIDEYEGSNPAPASIGDRDANALDSFDVEVGDSLSTVRVNEQEDLVITAIDRSGRRVQSYVDRVLIETSDTDAVLPSGSVRFKATDRGSKVLPLAIMFQTPGQQTVTVRDEADPDNVFGSTDVWVLGHLAAPMNREITVNEQQTPVAGDRTITVTGAAPAYMNLDLYSLGSDGEETRLATTSSDDEGLFSFRVTLDSDVRNFTLFVRDPEGRAKDSATFSITVPEAATTTSEEETPVETGIPVVTGVRAESANEDVLLTWNPVQEAIRYRIYIGFSAENFEQSKETMTYSTSVRLTGLKAGKTMFAAVTAIDAVGEESAEKSEIVSVTTKGSFFEILAIGIVNGARVQWVSPPDIGVVQYAIRYGVQPGVYTEERIVPAASTQYTLNDLINGVPYYISMNAKKNDGEILEDPAEVSVVPGERGMPGVHLAPPDPLPEWNGVIKPPHIPRSGFSMLLSIALFGAVVVGFLHVRRASKNHREIIALLLSGSASG